MIPFSDPGTHLQLARYRIDHMLQDASNHRLVPRTTPERPRLYRRLLIRRRPLTS
ncbi:hypothetical protein [Actinoplanes sp. CA-252034]|uniref:hypothetical protein n=1 Tax=Actinoplanes sp. CA-252034 TaxID=3239906 RepID=UPI003D957B85